MTLLTMHEVSISFGGPPLLDKVNLQIEHGERLSLLGRNGAGKTTLLKMVIGDLTPDSGVIVRPQGLRIAYLPQDVSQELVGTTFDVVAQALGKKTASLTEYHHLSSRLAEEYNEALLGQLDRIQDTLQAEDGWQIKQRVEKVLSWMKLDPSTPFQALSAGLKRRVLLAKTLVLEPEILLLDEPTNHLDIESIVWLEEFLLDFRGTLLFVTHDRKFLQRLATRIIELDRGKLISWYCGFETFLERKQALLDAEAEQWAQFDKKLTKEEEWFQQGIKARRTRNEGRVRSLGKLRELRRQRRQLLGSISVQMQEAERSGKMVICAEDLSFSFDDRPVIQNFSTFPGKRGNPADNR